MVSDGRNSSCDGEEVFLLTSGGHGCRIPVVVAVVMAGLDLEGNGGKKKCVGMTVRDWSLKISFILSDKVAYGLILTFFD